MLKKNRKNYRTYRSFIVKFSDYKTGYNLTVKDLFHVKDNLTTGGALPMKHHRSIIDSEVVSGLKLLGTIIGKDNLDEFGVGESGTSTIEGQVNYHGLKLGGSSTGTALNIFLNEAILGLGTDTGGSIRDVTYALNGIWGFKPSYGLLSRYGLIPHSNILDTPSLISKNINWLIMGLRFGMKYREKDTTLVKKVKWVNARYKDYLVLRSDHILCIGSNRILRFSYLQPSVISRCYYYWSAIYLYSNLNKFNNKIFSDRNNEWLFKPNLDGIENRWSNPIKRRRLWGLAHLRVVSKGKQSLHDHMLFLRGFYYRLINILGSRYLLVSPVRDMNEGNQNWALTLANLASCPALSYGNFNFFSCRWSDPSLLRLFTNRWK